MKRAETINKDIAALLHELQIVYKANAVPFMDGCVVSLTSGQRTYVSNAISALQQAQSVFQD